MNQSGRLSREMVRVLLPRLKGPYFLQARTALRCRDAYKKTAAKALAIANLTLMRRLPGDNRREHDGNDQVSLRVATINFSVNHAAS
jgi:hypothetical protein